VSASRDDGDVTRSFDDRTADALLGGRAVEGEPELSAFVADLTALAEAAPTPSRALAELLEHGLVGVAAPVPAPPAVRRRWSPAPVWARLVTAGALAVAAVLSAAAANALPGSAQNAVADVVGWVTPVHLPHADDEGGPAPAPSPSATTTAEPQATPATARRTPGPGERTSGSGDSTTGGSGGSGTSDDSGSGPDSGTADGSDDGTTGGSSDGTTGGASVPGGSDDSSPSPTPDPDDTPTPTPSDGSGGSDTH
jgi:hypothetical protein